MKQFKKGHHTDVRGKKKKKEQRKYFKEQQLKISLIRKIKLASHFRKHGVPNKTKQKRSTTRHILIKIIVTKTEGKLTIYKVER